MPLLTWGKLNPRDNAVMGGRGKINFYKACQNETRKRMILSCYLHGAMQSDLAFDTLEEAQAFAEVDFGDWLKRTGLAAR